MKVLFGADPEVFLKKDKEFISGFNTIPGTKEEPYKVYNGAVQVDGLALEFNIDPGKNYREFSYNINSVLSQLKQMIPEGHKIAIIPSVTFDERHYDLQPKEAKVLGCDPDYNAYTGLQNNIPVLQERTFRTAGGHIHIGWLSKQLKDPYSPNHFETCRLFVKALDEIYLITSLYDKDRKRRNLYGKAGAFRAKPYGVEYRSLSNFWIEKIEYQFMIYILTKLQLKRFIKTKGVRYCGFGYTESIRRVFNYNDPRESIQKINANIPEILKYFSPKRLQDTYSNWNKKPETFINLLLKEMG